jgi:hypothetical protein
MYACDVIKQDLMIIAASLGSVVVSKSRFQPKQASQMRFTSLGSSAGPTCLPDSFLKEHNKKERKLELRKGRHREQNKGREE